MKILPRSQSLTLLLVLLAALLFLSSCLPRLDPGPAPARIRLNPALPGPIEGKASKRQLTVCLPSVSGDIDNDRISLVFHSREVRYLAGLRWTGNLAPMLQRHMIAALESSKALSGVGDELTGLSARARLTTDVRQFALVYNSDTAPPEARFTATFRLLNLSDARIAGTRTLDIRVPATGRDNDAMVVALEKALQQGLAEMTAWVIQAMK
jgi:cholesterol transport system auxiliary component